MTLEQAAALHLAELGPGSVREATRTWLTLWVAWCLQRGLVRLADLSAAELRCFEQDLRWQPHSRGRLYSAHTLQVVTVRVRRFLGWAFARGWLRENLAQGLTVRRILSLPARLLTALELATLRAAPDRRQPRGLRDALVLELVATTRLPLTRLGQLPLDQVVTLELEPATQGLLDLYLTEARPALVREGTTLLFGSPFGQGLSTSLLGLIVDSAATAAKLSRAVTPRLLRRSYQAHLERSTRSRLSGLEWECLEVNPERTAQPRGRGR